MTFSVAFLTVPLQQDRVQGAERLPGDQAGPGGAGAELDGGVGRGGPRQAGRVYPRYDQIHTQHCRPGEGV